MAMESDAVWGANAPRQTMEQVARLIEGKFPHLHTHVRSDGESFAALPKDVGEKVDGIVCLHGELIDGDVIALRVDLVSAGAGLLVQAEPFFQAFGSVGERCHPFARDDGKGMHTLGMELRMKAMPMGMARSNAFVAELDKLNDLARTLQTELPKQAITPDVAAEYEKLKEYVALVEPFGALGTAAERELYDWAVGVLAFVDGGASVAIAGEAEVVTELALALVAQASIETGSSLGAPVPTMMNPQVLLELARKAPGVLAVPAASIGLGSQRYDLGQDIMAMLTALRTNGRAVVFHGRMKELQSVFHGGQGGESDPLKPVLCRVPDIPAEMLVRFCVRRACGTGGSLPASSGRQLGQAVLDAMSGRAGGDWLRLLPIMVGWGARRLVGGQPVDAAAVGAYMDQLGSRSESLSGLPDRPRGDRLPHVQARFTSRFVQPGLLPYLADRLISQDVALREFAGRMRTEALTRPPHQPLRGFLLGTAATGKTQCVELAAQYLGVPYVNIDAASMPDFYTASAQLLGSGRGIVNSHQAGRLEQVAKHHIGAMVEISDTDHAVPAVRGPLVDLFLQLLESGEAQAASGAMFSVANVVFIFTMNLPSGEDETARRSIGFAPDHNRDEIRTRMVDSLKRMFSSAFLSRIGAPIIFDPLAEADVAVLVERTLQSAAETALERLGVHHAPVAVAPGTGAWVMASFTSNLASFGARAVLEHGRDLAAAAVAGAVAARDLSNRELVLKASGIGLELGERQNTEGKAK